MHRPTDPTASPIRARIHERALSRVTKLFNAGLGDIFAELFQNARRGGAGRIHVTVERIPSQFEGDRVVTVTDDGAGIADPAVLLSFGESGWMPGRPNVRMPPAWGSCRSRGAVALCARACGAKRPNRAGGCCSRPIIFWAATTPRSYPMTALRLPGAPPLRSSRTRPPRRSGRLSWAPRATRPCP